MGMYDAQEASIRRQQMIAKALRDSGNQGFDPAATAGKLVYARSPWEDINKVAQQATAAYLDNRAEKRLGELQDQRKADAKTRLAGMVDTLAGKSDMQAQANPNAKLQDFSVMSVRNPITGATENVYLGESPQAPVFTSPEKVETNQKRAGLAAILKGADPEAAAAMLEGKAMEKVIGDPDRIDLGGQWGFVKDGVLVSTIDKSATQDARLGANVTMRGQDASERNNIRDNRTSASNNANTVAAQRYATDAGIQNNQLDNETSRLNAQLAAEVSRDNEALRAKVDREKIEATKAGGKRLVDWESKALTFQGRMESSEAYLDKNYQPGFWVTMQSNVPVIGETGLLKSNEYNLYRQAAREWISGLLRYDSGAAVPESEFARYFATYFPQVGESAEVRAQKAAARRSMMERSRGILGEIADRLPPPPYLNKTEAGKTPAVKIASDDEYNKLQSGTKFIDPNGQERVKP